MAERLLRVLTSLTGLLVLAGVNDALGERGVAGIGSAYAQPLVAEDEDFEGEDYASEDEESDDSEDYPEESDEDSTEDMSAPEEDEEEEEEESEPADDRSGKGGGAAQPVAGQPRSDVPTPTASGTQTDGLSKEERIHTLLIHYTRQVLTDLGTRAIQDSDSLEALGADSVDRREIIRLTWQSAGLIELSIPESELAEAENIGEMVRIMAAEMP